MNRKRLVVALLAGCSLLLAFVYGRSSAVRADLPQSTATIIYQPDFEEWAFLYLLAAYRDQSGGSHFVGVQEETINGKIRFKIVGTYTNDHNGQAWYDKVGSKIRGKIEADCQRWTAAGFPIDLKDFDIKITQTNERPQ